MYIQGVLKKKDILNVLIQSDRINIILQKNGKIEITRFVVKCLKFTIRAHILIKWHSSEL